MGPDDARGRAQIRPPQGEWGVTPGAGGTEPFATHYSLSQVTSGPAGTGQHPMRESRIGCCPVWARSGTSHGSRQPGYSANTPGIPSRGDQKQFVFRWSPLLFFQSTSKLTGVQGKKMLMAAPPLNWETSTSLRYSAREMGAWQVDSASVTMVLPSR